MEIFTGYHVILLQICIVLWLCTLTFVHPLSALVEKAFEKVYPTKLLGGIIASCFLLIGFVVSFHSEVFTAHDIYNVDKNQKGLKKNAYNWFNLSHVYRFPIEQFTPESAIIQVNKFTSDKFENTQINNYLFIIDKTGSALEDPITKKVTKILKEQLIEELGNKLNFSSQKITNLTDISDVLLFFSIYNQYKHIIKSNPISKIKVGIYWGLDNQRIEYLNNFQNFTITEIDSLISSYSKKIANNKGTYSITDYTELINGIRKSGCDDVTLKPDTIVNFAVTLIGDLYHENDKTIQVLDQRLSELSVIENRIIEQVNLFRVPINPRTLSKDKSLAEAEANANQVELFIKDRFKKYLLFSELKTSTIVSARYSKDFINSQIIQPNNTISDESEISMYFPFLSPNGLINSTATVKFYKKDKPLKDSIYVTLRSNDESETSGEMKVNNKQIIKLNETSKIMLEEDGNINLSFLGNRAGENFYLDFYFPKSQNRINSQLVFRKKLTDTSALCLIFLYTLLFSSMTFLLIILGIVIYKKASNRFYSGIFGPPLAILPIIIFILSYFPNVFILFESHDNCFWLKLTFSALFPLLYIVLLFTFNRKVIVQGISTI